MPEMILFGAGASVEGLVPDSNKMTERIVEEFGKVNHPKRHIDVIKFVIGGLLFKKGIQGENPLNAGVNVEELFNAVQLLSERNVLEAAPFIGSWHSMIEELDRFEYLLPILNALKTQKKLTVATLNYDNGIEKLAALKNVPCKTGIEGWENSGKFEMGSEGLSLLKLHGSIDWLYASAVTEEKPMPFFLLQIVPEKPKFMQDFMPAIIFGQKNKLTAEGPFLDLLRTFQQELANIDRLTIVGYSFGDPHINVYLSQWLNKDTGNQMRIIDPFFNSNPREYAVQLRSLADKQIQVLPVKASEGLAQLYPA